MVNEPEAKIKSDYEPYFLISKPRYARKRTVDFNMEAITKHKNKYAGYICFLTNRKMTKPQIFSHIKAIAKIHFQGKYKDVFPQLSKNQRLILDALEIKI